MNQRVVRLFDLAADLPLEERESFLARECPDPVVREEVLSLLRYEPEAEGFLADAIRGAVQSLRTGGEAEPGEVIGAYRIVSLIEHGGMGSVYLAERADGELEQRVAIKLLHSYGHRSEWRDRFRKERQLLASLQHPAIVHVIDAGHTTDGRPFLVMEHVDGVTIDVYAARVAVRERLQLFLQVCDAVSHAHRRLIIHCDLKPSNILVDRSGQPKLLDFGIARLLDETGDATQTVERLLTPNYASPEQLAGAPKTTATDVYSLGAVLYRLLAGMAPGTADGGTAKSAIAPPSRLNPDVPRDVDFIVLKALRAEPEARYVSVDEFAADIRAALAWKPVQARSGNLWYHARRFLRRHWVTTSAIALVAASVGGGLWIANRQRALAERRFGQLRQLAGKVIDLDRSIRTLPGSIDARRRLVAASLGYLEGLAPEARGDLDLAHEIAEGYWRLGRIQGVNAEPNLGDPEKAELSLKKADGLIEEVLASRPADRNALFLAAVISHDRMILANTSDRQSDCRGHAARAVERLEAFLRGDEPQDPIRLDGFLRPGNGRQPEQSGVSLLYGNIALTYVNLHLYEEGARYARRAAELARPIPSAADLYSAGLSVLANALRYQGRLEEALQTIREAREISNHATYPNPTARLFNRYGPLIREGLILGERGAINLGRPAEAAEAFQNALDLVREGAGKDASDSASRSRVATVARELGGVLRDRDPGRALANYDLGIRELEEIGDRPKARRDLAQLLAASSYPLRRLHRAREARRRIDQAMALLTKMNDYPAARIYLGSPVCEAVSALADYESETGDPRRALRMYQQLLEQVQASRPDALGDLRDAPKLSEIYQRLAALYRRSGDSARADLIDAQRVALWRHWEQKLPQNLFVRRQLEIGDKGL